MRGEVLGRVLATITKGLSNPIATGSIYLISIYFNLSYNIILSMMGCQLQSIVVLMKTWVKTRGLLPP